MTAYALIIMLCCVLALALVEAGDAKPRTSSATSSAQFEGHRVGNQAWQWRWEVWLPDKWQRIGACETGYGKRPGDWEWNSGIYQGFAGFYHGTWDQYKPVAWWPDEAYLASPWQQFQTALAVYRVHGYGAWGCGGA